MPLSPSHLREMENLGLQIDHQVKLATLGSFQLGGPAPYVVNVPHPEDLQKVILLLADLDQRPILIGEGTNILFSDAGWDGVILRCAGGIHLPVPVGNGQWRVHASMSLEGLVDWAITSSLSGLEPFVGIPGTVGGAVVGNAGAWGVQMADRLMEVSGWFQDGTPYCLPVSECGFTYRNSMLKEQGAWVSDLVIQLTEGDQETLVLERERILEERAARHPEWRTTPCIGSFFKNLEPSSAAERRQAAGWFLEQAGAKEMQVGGASVFPKHANIPIKASEECTASDVAHLALQMKDAVQEKHNITLQREVRFLGDLPGYEGQRGFW